MWATELRRHTVKSGKTASYSTAIYMMLLTMFSIIQLPDNVSLLNEFMCRPPLSTLTLWNAVSVGDVVFTKML